MTLHLTPPKPVGPPAWHIVPVPIREGEVVHLHVPSDLSPAEAKKVARVAVAIGQLSVGRGTLAEQGEAV